MSKLITVSEYEWDKLVARVKELEYDLASCRRGSVIRTKTEEHLHKRIKELEDGCCRFNCRTQKEAYIAGAQDAIYRIKRYEDGAAPTLAEIQKAYKEWKESKDG